MFYVQVSGGKVVNRVVFDEAMPDDWPDRTSWFASETAQIGWAYEDGAFAPPPPPTPEPSEPLPLRIAKNAIWERATEQEAEVMEAMLSAQHIRIRRIYEGATHISTDHELFTLLAGALTQAFGAERAAELLAPTE